MELNINPGVLLLLIIAWVLRDIIWMYTWNHLIRKTWSGILNNLKPFGENLGGAIKGMMDQVDPTWQDKPEPPPPASHSTAPATDSDLDLDDEPDPDGLDHQT